MVKFDEEANGNWDRIKNIEQIKGSLKNI